MDEMGCKKGCPCFDPKSKSSHCTAIGDNGLEKLALDLINRQKAQIAELESESATLKHSNINLQELYYAEKEKVAKYKQKVIDVCKQLQTAKAEIEELKLKNSNLTSDLTSLQKDLTSAKAEIEMNDAEIKELRIALQGYLDDVTKTRNLYKQSIEKLNQANAEVERLMLCINELKHEVGRHERNYDPSEEVDNLINSIIQPLSASAVAEMAEKAIENHTKFEMFKAKIKSEAYREFAERLKEDSFDIVLFGEVVTMHTINEILKELVGEDDG
jgi:chromosome segregation ATPase